MLLKSVVYREGEKKSYTANQNTFKDVTINPFMTLTRFIKAYKIPNRDRLLLQDCLTYLLKIYCFCTDFQIFLR